MSHETAKRLAAQLGVSYRTIQRAAAFARAVDRAKELNPGAVDKILAGRVRDSRTRLPILMKDENLARKVLQRIAEAPNEGAQVSIKEIVRELSDTTDVHEADDLKAGWGGLYEVIAIWPKLPEHRRHAILCIIRGHKRRIAIGKRSPPVGGGGNGDCRGDTQDA